MLEKTQIKIIAVPYKNFRQKVRIIKKFEKRYHIEDLAGDAVCGRIGMQKLTKIENMKLALKYSTSEKHRKSLRKRIAEIENNADVETKKENIQESFL